MEITPDTIFLCEQVRSTAWQEAHTFHQAQQALHPKHVLLRSDVEIEEFAKQGWLFGVCQTDLNSLVGLCYIKPTSDEHEWELGGLTIVEDAQRWDIGELLIRVIIAVYTVLDFPQFYGGAIFAHVLTDNEPAQTFFNELGFDRHEEPDLFPRESVPESMRPNSGGDVFAYRFTFPNSGLCQLARWFEEFDRTLLSGARVQIDLRTIPLEALRTDLIEAVRILGLQCNS